jgi:1,2-diacylglycerol 3-beta-galactosyltransferase
MHEETKKKKIIVCFADVGGGHRSVAMAIQEYISYKYPEIEVELGNIAKDYGDYFLRHSGQFYSLMIKRFPLIWEHLFVKSLTKFPLLGHAILAIAWNKYKRNIGEFIEENPADLYVSTLHFYGYYLEKYRYKRKKDYKIMTIVTDICYMNFFWVVKGHDLIILPTKEIYEHGKKFLEGIEKKVKVFGLPINQKYYNTVIPPVTGKGSKLNVLIATGGEGASNIWKLCQGIDELKNKNISVQVSVGKNNRLENKISSKKWNISITAFGWVAGLIDKYIWSDIIITKAGPTTIWECMIMDRPMIIYSYIKGQEDGNIEYALKYSRSVYIKSFDKIVEKIKNISKNGIKKEFPYPKNYNRKFTQTNWTEKICEEIVKL